MIWSNLPVIKGHHTWMNARNIEHCLALWHTKYSVFSSKQVLNCRIDNTPRITKQFLICAKYQNLCDMWHKMSAFVYKYSLMCPNLYETSCISDECKLPACREYGLHKIWRDVDILLWPWYDLHLNVWPWPY